MFPAYNEFEVPQKLIAAFWDWSVTVTWAGAQILSEDNLKSTIGLGRTVITELAVSLQLFWVVAIYKILKNL